MAEDEVAKNKGFLLLYGSETGQAQAIAELIFEESTKRGYSPKLSCLSCLDNFKLEESPVMVMVVSTTGEGEPPETVCKFWRRLKKKSLPSDHLKNLQFALLGLGDSNYTNFCNMGKMMNKRLLELGARPFHETGYADDGVGLELVVEPWIEGLWSNLEHMFLSGSSLVSSDSDVLSVQPCQAEGTTTSTVVPLINAVTDDQLQQTDSSLSSKMDGLTLAKSNVLSRKLTSWEKDILLGSSTKSWEETPLSTPSVQHSSFSLELTEVSTIPQFDYSESVNGALKGDHHITMATVKERKQLTSDNSEKVTLELILHWNMSETEQETVLTYQPGDAVCVVCPNDSSEVEYLINRLSLVPRADYMLQLSVPSGAKDKIIPKHIPSQCTVRQYFTHCADIRAIPKKSLLSVLAYHCTNEFERRRLQWLTTKHGSADYARIFIEQHTDLLDILHVFQSCQPPLDSLIKVLPRLQPRYYSAASSPMTHPNSLKIVFNLINLPQREWMSVPRTGLCSGWLNQIALLDSARVVQVPLYPRLRNPFHLPPDPLVPIIMVGPGTGVAPFMGFLQHRSNLKSSGIVIGKMWLFYGCRHPDKDFIYEDELKLHLSSRVLTRLDVSFSRLRIEQPDIDHESRTESYNVGNKYVQDNISANGAHIVSWIMKDHAAVYVCGDAKHMARDVKSAFVNVLDKHLESTEHLDSTTVLQEEGRYLVDAWT